jgi:hypothetical protein
MRLLSQKRLDGAFGLGVANCIEWIGEDVKQPFII